MVVSACSVSTQTFAPAGTAGNSAAKTAASLDSWRRSLAEKGLPGAGCFKAAYPSTEWSRIACSTPPRVWFPVPRSRRSKLTQTVGNGNDFTADTTPNLIHTAIGAFPKVKGVTSVQSVGCCGYQGLNSYSIQLNSYFFTTSACGTIANCAGWEQFVLSNPSGSTPASLFIQDWLVGTKGSLSGCPPGKGWQYVGIGCVQNSPSAVGIPNIAITDLGQLVETGSAASSGDSIYLAVGGTQYGMKNIQSDGITDLAAHWEGSEFNIIGNGGGDVANFNAGSKITVSLEAADGVETKPTCPADTGTTGESNNLYFVKAPRRPAKLLHPSIEFTMSSTNSGNASCDVLKGI